MKIYKLAKLIQYIHVYNEKGIEVFTIAETEDNEDLAWKRHLYLLKLLARPCSFIEGYKFKLEAENEIGDLTIHFDNPDMIVITTISSSNFHDKTISKIAKVLSKHYDMLFALGICDFDEYYTKPIIYDMAWLHEHLR